MNVECAVRRQRNRGVGKHVAVRHNNADLRIERAQAREHVVTPRPFGLEDRNPFLVGDSLYGRRIARMAMPGVGSIGLRYHAHNVMSFA